MTTKAFLLPAIILGLAGQLFAGGVLEMSTKNSSGATVVASRMYAQAGKLRMDQMDESGAVQTSAIFQNNEMVMVNYADKKFHRIDEKTLAQLGAQMQKASAAMKQLEQQMANMPPEQRAMMEKMMKGRMAGMAGMGAKPPVIRFEADGMGTWQSYTCKNYTVYAGDQKTQEMCTVPASKVEGAEEFVAAARNMKEFFDKFKEALQMPGLANLAQNPAEVIGQVEGFPVHTKEFENGVLRQEKFLSSSKTESLSDSLFSPPQGFREEKFMRGQGGSR
jgi:hypothetical protein